MIDELQNSEGGEIPTVIEGETIENQVNVSWTVHTKKKKVEQQIPGQMDLFSYASGSEQPSSSTYTSEPTMPQHVAEDPVPYTVGGQTTTPQNNQVPQNSAPVGTPAQGQTNTSVETPSTTPTVTPSGENVVPAEVTGKQMSVFPEIDREDVIKFINEQGYLTYMVKDVRINSYLKSLLSLAGLLTHNSISVSYTHLTLPTKA